MLAKNMTEVGKLGKEVAADFRREAGRYAKNLAKRLGKEFVDAPIQ